MIDKINKSSDTARLPNQSDRMCDPWTARRLHLSLTPQPTAYSTGHRHASDPTVPGPLRCLPLPIHRDVRRTCHQCQARRPPEWNSARLEFVPTARQLSEWHLLQQQS
jgi:hypothetical protein